MARAVARRRWTDAGRRLSVCCWLAVCAVAQQPDPQDVSKYRRFDDKTVTAVRIVWVDEQGRELPPRVRQYTAERLIQVLKTKSGEPFVHAEVAQDLQQLWQRFKLSASLRVPEPDGDGVSVVFELKETRTFSRVRFQGLEHFTEVELRDALGLDARTGLDEATASTLAVTIEDRYRGDGYFWVEVNEDKDDRSNTLTFRIDEGPQVTINEVIFRGNRSFPGSAPLGLYDNLIGSSDMESTPGGILPGAPYSFEKVLDDLDRLEFFYRKQGFRDAEVELAHIAFSDDRETVDLTFRVFEGRRWRIGTVDLLQRPSPTRGAPLYPKEDVLAVVKTEAGDYFDQLQIDLDKLAIQEFYGERGHPSREEYGRGIQDAFRIVDPGEVYDFENAEIHLTFIVDEGTPKTLNDIVIRGNQFTKDFVIRRNIRILPGEILDTVRLRRSLNNLDALRYFQDPVDLSGVSFTLRPVEDRTDAVDLEVGVQEGDTGSFIWGAGVSTNFGVQARFVFTKRNFDLTRLPSSPNPLTVINEVASNRAFHGAGQELELMLAPGTEFSLFRLSFYDPDIFNHYFDTIGLSVRGFRRFRFLDSFSEDALGGSIGLERNFTQNFSAGLNFRQETVRVEDVAINAPTIVWDAEGSNELRGFRLSANHRDLDHPLRPTAGHTFNIYGETVGGVLGGDESFVKTGLALRYYYPLFLDSSNRAHVLHWRQQFDWGQGIDESETLFVTERFPMGGNTLRGFDQRRAGPTQFGQPLSGEARLLTSLQYEFPLVSTRMENRIRQTEILRGFFFADFGLLGTAIDDPTFREPRLGVGIGIKINVPILGLPIELALGWPIVREDTDQQRQFIFSLAR